MSSARLGALACFATAAIWPWAMGALSFALMSPIERAARAGWCGVSAHAAAETFGHCAACWAGSAILIAAGTWILSQSRMHPRWRPALIKR
jgi:hypothetical protein